MYFELKSCFEHNRTGENRNRMNRYTMIYYIDHSNFPPPCRCPEEDALEPALPYAAGARPCPTEGGSATGASATKASILDSRGHFGIPCSQCQQVFPINIPVPQPP